MFDELKEVIYVKEINRFQESYDVKNFNLKPPVVFPKMYLLERG